MSLLKRKLGATQDGLLAMQADPVGGRDRGSDHRAGNHRAGSGQRIRLGLTGLAAIFLLVLIAAAGLRPDQSRAASETAGEPLAVLGVAPGAGPAVAERDSTLPASTRQVAVPAASRPTRG